MKVGFGRWLSASYVALFVLGYLSLAIDRFSVSTPVSLVGAACAVGLIALSLHMRRINDLQWDRPGWLAVSWPMPPGWSTAFVHLVAGRELGRALRTIVRPERAEQLV